ncbi:P450-derived glycosyltransferase activator [Streptomyces cyaneofuscatus]|uniref:cytochrome P450 family protein n=1 Tax=Streptomyces cyaneofuscatus TaxID=66883 RepID=UPI0033A3EB7D
MTTTQTDSETGHRLLLARGFQWLFGAEGDPYALVLRAENDDRAELARDIRERGPLYRSAIGCWVTAHHEIGARILADARFGIRHADIDGPQQHPLSLDDFVTDEDVMLCHLITLDDVFIGHEHDYYQRLGALAHPLIEEALDAHRSTVAEIAGRLVDQALESRSFDLAGDFARPLAAEAAARLLGIPGPLRDRFARLSEDLAAALDAEVCAQRYETVRALRGAADELRELLSAGTTTPGGTGADSGLLSRLNTLTGNGSGGRDDDPVAIGTLIATAGVEVTAGLIANSAAALTGTPESWTRLASEPSLAPRVVAETLRFAPPVQIEARIAHADIELAGQSITAGSSVIVWVAGAGRDPEAFYDPDRFDLDRFADEGPDLGGRGARGLALPAGTPAALVAPLAVPAAATALGVLAERLPELRRTGPVLHRVRSAVQRGVLRLPVSAW